MRLASALAGNVVRVPAAVGLVLVVVSLFLPWTYLTDANVVDQRVRAWDGYHGLGGVVILLGVALSLTGWRTGGDVERAGLTVGALMVALGLVVQWSATRLYTTADVRTSATIGPGVPLATAGLVLLCAANVLRHRTRRQPRAPVVPVSSRA